MAAQHIGIVAGSAEGAALCYRTICTEGPEQLGGYAHPEVSLHTVPFEEYVACMDRDDWRGVGELMLSSAERLARAGADFVICPDNTFHQGLPYIESRSPVPWVHIAEAVADEAEAKGYKRVGLLGTRWLVESDVYPHVLGPRGIERVLATPAQREEVNRIIMDQLVRGQIEPQSRSYLQAIIAEMKDAGCDAVILGCTELPLIITKADSVLPILDSTRLLARAALRRATQQLEVTPAK